MKISIFGLGYVGTVACGCLAREGHAIIGVDVNKTKVGMIKSGRPPVIEEKIGGMLRRAVSCKRLKATDNAKEAVLNTDISFICVGTPSNPNGALDISFVESVSREIGRALKDKDAYHLVAVRSTVLPGTTKGVIIPILEMSSGKTAGRDFGVCHNPEFMREGSSVYDYYNPPKTVIGASDGKSAGILKKLYKKLPGPKITTSIEVSEMVKYIDNNFHAVKITFANEIGALCKKLGIDSHEVMGIFCRDEKLNISPVYLKPGFAFGGSCLPKDIRAVLYEAKARDLELPLIGSILLSNTKQVDRVLDGIIRIGKKKIGILGFSFKAGTDDLRMSPMVELVERLLGKGYKIKLYDRNVNLAKLVGANKRFIEKRIPHIARLMRKSANDVIRDSDIVIIGNESGEFVEILKRIRKNQIIIDLVRIDKKRKSEGNYSGIAW